MFKFDFLPDEKLIMVYRQTEWVLVKPVAIVFATLYLPWYLLLKYELFARFSLVLLAWTLVILIYFAHKLLLWILNSYILTDQRLIIVHYKSVFRRNVTETPLERILNVSYETTGIFSSLFKFGDILVKTMGLNEPLELKSIRNPSKIKDFLWKIHSKHGNAQNFSPASTQTSQDGHNLEK
jgi:uncharacterized membrane protein YdbT with pleckstrin-like domain